MRSSVFPDPAGDCTRNDCRTSSANARCAMSRVEQVVGVSHRRRRACAVLRLRSGTAAAGRRCGTEHRCRAASPVATPSRSSTAKLGQQRLPAVLRHRSQVSRLAAAWQPPSGPGHASWSATRPTGPISPALSLAYAAARNVDARETRPSARARTSQAAARAAAARTSVARRVDRRRSCNR